MSGWLNKWFHLRKAPLSTFRFNSRYSLSCCCSAVTLLLVAPTLQRVSAFSYSSSSSASSSQTSRTAMAMNARKAKEAMMAPSVLHAPSNLVPSWMPQERTKLLTPSCSIDTLRTIKDRKDDGCIVYWMHRDVRTRDNWALLYARHLAQEQGVPLQVLYTLTPSPLIPTQSHSNEHQVPNVLEMSMTERHGTFLLGGLQQVQKELQALNIPFHLLTPTSHATVGDTVVQNCHSLKASAIICDFTPLRHVREWMEHQTATLLEKESNTTKKKKKNLPLIQVDAHNVVPVWHASPKREVGARTLRPKINKLLKDFLVDFPTLQPNDSTLIQDLEFPTIDWKSVQTGLNLDPSVPSVPGLVPGHEAAWNRFLQWCSTNDDQGLMNFDSARNDPNHSQVCTNLSPYVNHGHIAFARMALHVQQSVKGHANGKAAFLEEGIVRRELSDNFLYYSQDNYDDLTTAAGWAQETLEVHAADEREHVYSLQEFVEGRTHDDLWNAAQIQLVQEGNMHGFLRMYWAKKILEWTESPTIALRTALYLNDRYALDGNDPNGFTGVGWSIMGIHDMGWKERDIFGKIRFMNYAGCKRKFDVNGFVDKYGGARANAIQVQKEKGMPIQKKTTGKRKRKAVSK